MWKNFSRIKSRMPTGMLLNQIEKNPALWSEITARQTTKGSPHCDTESIFLRWCADRSVKAVFSEIPAIDYPAYKFLPAARDLVNAAYELVGGQELGRVLITKLKPGGFIDRHADEGAYADHYERFHISLDSEVGNAFYVDDEPNCGEFVYMARGDLYWFNHKKPHYAYNASKIPRIHLIMDIVAPNYRRERDAISA